MRSSAERFNYDYGDGELAGLREQIESTTYRIQADKRGEFVAAVQDVREMRRRNGAYFWQLFHDSEDPTRFIETFMHESWMEHLRQHVRASLADRAIQQRAKQYLAEGASTRSSHWLGDRES